MSEFKLTTPVAFIIFNRPDTTALVFAEIAKARPPKLLVVGDGPRAHKAGEAERVTATRAIIEQIDWPCEVLTHFSETNLGCKKGFPVASTGFLTKSKKQLFWKMTVCQIHHSSNSARKCLSTTAMTRE